MSTPCKITCILRGGLGNRLFIFAAMMGFSYKNASYQPLMTLENTEPFYQSNQVVDASYFFRLVNTEQKIPIDSVFKEPGYDAISRHGYDYPFHNIPAHGNILLDGYFQNEEYFSGIEPWLYHQFKCPAEILPNLLSAYPQLGKGAFLHIRRTDTVHLPYPDITAFYNQCLCMFSDDTVFFVCSDDLDWCKSNIHLPADRVVFVNEDALRTLWIMSLCGHGGIMGISTFSWWGGWLNRMQWPASTVYCPNSRFNPVSKLFKIVNIS